MGFLSDQWPYLLLGLLRHCLDCLGSNLRLRCFRSDSHRLNTSFHWLSQPTATFCAASWVPQSPNWLEVVSQSAQSGNGAAKQMSELLYSISSIKDNSGITLGMAAEAGVSSRATGWEGATSSGPAVSLQD